MVHRPLDPNTGRPIPLKDDGRTPDFDKVSKSKKSKGSDKSEDSKAEKEGE